MTPPGIKFGVSPTPSPRRLLRTGTNTPTPPSSCSDFTIPSTAGLVAWLDTCVFSSMTIDVNDTIVGMQDQSSNGYSFNAGPENPGYLAIGFNGRPTISFSNLLTLQSLNYPTVALGTGNELTMFAAASLDTGGFHTNGRLMSYTGTGEPGDTNNNGSFAILNAGATSNLAFIRNSVSGPSDDIGFNTNHRIIFTLKSDGTRTLYVDGIPTSEAGAVANFVSPGFLSLGGSQTLSAFDGNLTGLVSEWGLYNIFHDATAVGLLDTYLMNKWGF